jgi:predicted nucleic acid-binding protein
LPGVFVDTSAIYALLDRSDANHAAAASLLPTLRDRGPLTHSYVVVESVALTQARLGIEAVRRLLDDLLPAFELRFVSRQLHGAAVAALLASGSGDVSLVDRVSFEVMRSSGLTEAFAFDRHFEREGFTVV